MMLCVALNVLIIQFSSLCSFIYNLRNTARNLQNHTINHWRHQVGTIRSVQLPSQMHRVTKSIYTCQNDTKTTVKVHLKIPLKETTISRICVPLFD